jgi:MEDS: MEthanogen/methylotroph, DcmR Sensory domain
MENNNPRKRDRNQILESIMNSKFGEHNIVLYSDVSTLPYLYSHYSKRSSESSNEIVLILPHYQSITDVLHILKNSDIDFDRTKKEGSIVVVESKKAYYSLIDQFVGIMIMVEMLLQRAKKLNKMGITVISDMGLFFHLDRLDDLIKWETELSSSIYAKKVRILCNFSQTDFGRLNEKQRQHLLESHSKIINE